MFFLLSAEFFSKSSFSKKKPIRMSNILDPHQARRFVGPDLGPKYMYLQSLSADPLRNFVLQIGGVLEQF